MLLNSEIYAYAYVTAFGLKPDNLRELIPWSAKPT
jgi:hypothetical protein